MIIFRHSWEAPTNLLEKVIIFCHSQGAPTYHLLKGVIFCKMYRFPDLDYSYPLPSIVWRLSLCSHKHWQMVLENKSKWRVTNSNNYKGSCFISKKLFSCTFDVWFVIFLEMLSHNKSLLEPLFMWIVNFLVFVDAKNSPPYPKIMCLKSSLKPSNILKPYIFFSMQYPFTWIPVFHSFLMLWTRV